MNHFGRVALMLTLSAVGFGCGGSEDADTGSDSDSASDGGTCAVGSEGCACTSGGGCDAPLECRSDLCVAGDPVSGPPPPGYWDECTVVDDVMTGCGTEPATQCMGHANAGFCTSTCRNHTDCPLPPDGAATPQCEVGTGYSFCYLDCGMGTCPEGRNCVRGPIGPAPTLNHCI